MKFLYYLIGLMVFCGVGGLTCFLVCTSDTVIDIQYLNALWTVMKIMGVGCGITALLAFIYAICFGMYLCDAEK